ncbi:hypothetical protein A3K72_01875 [Candidatus Woesearchaeota archaeon RBG_13_36_6]|nr:MAG: hypothetical protein A3K72_01875 [Candidatus Woesearchaeota archaeon RBG_13_36_6]
MKNEQIKTNEKIKEEMIPLDTPIGTKEQSKLKEGRVIIDSVDIDDVQNKEGKNVGKKVVCLCKHPDKEELVSISSAKHQVGDVIKIAGLWFNRDDDSKIVKNSALAHLMVKVGAKTPKELSGKEVEAIKDKNDYLCFKAY